VGGIGVLAAVEEVEAGNVDLIAPQGVVDAGDAGIRVTGNLNIAATTVLNAGNIQTGGNFVGCAFRAATACAESRSRFGFQHECRHEQCRKSGRQFATRREEKEKEKEASIVVVEVVGYGGGRGPRTIPITP
jgi:hypothetical protein